MTGCAPTVAQALLPFPQYCNNITGLDENLRSSTFTLQGCFPRRKLLRHCRDNSTIELVPLSVCATLQVDEHSTFPVEIIR
jgi:hypothetical protein